MNYSIHTFELSLYIESEGKRCKNKSEISKGIEVKEFDNKHGRLIRLKVNPSKLLKGDDSKLWKPNHKNVEKLIDKLRRHIAEFFDNEFELDYFDLTRIDFTVDFPIGSKKRVAAYIQILHNFGKVSGFKMKYNQHDYENDIDIDSSYDLIKSDGTGFTFYDKWKQCGLDQTEGILRAEVRLTKKKAIKKHTDETTVSEQIRDLSNRSKHIFLKIFSKVIFPGMYCTMKRASEIINRDVSKVKQQGRMLHLLKLTKKMSLNEAKAKMKDKNFDRVMRKFAEIGLSPVTIRKRYGISELKSLYDYFE